MSLTRRDFLKYGSMVPAAGLAPLTLSAAEDCPATSADILGPFYQPNAPFRKQVASPAEPGKRLIVQGTVRNCKGPVKGAVVDVWHATADGCYSINQKCGVIPGNPDEFRLRGQVRTDDKGRYEFLTIKPPPYDTGRGNFRPAHIHYKVSVPGATGSGKDELITQLYFAGEKYNDTDSSSKKPEAKQRIIALTEKSGVMRGVFNLVVPNLPSAGARTSAELLDGYDLLVQQLPSSVHFRIPEQYVGASILVLSRPNGSVVREWELSQNSIEWRTSGVQRGVYVARVFSGSDIEQAVHIRI